MKMKRGKFFRSLSERTLEPWNHWDVLSIRKEMAATIQKLWNEGQHFRKEKQETLNFWDRLLWSNLKCQNSMTDTHRALTKSDSGFWKIKDAKKWTNEVPPRRFNDYDYKAQWRMMNERWNVSRNFIHPYIHSVSVSWDTYWAPSGKLFTFFIIRNYSPPIFNFLGLNWEEKNKNFF